MSGERAHPFGQGVKVDEPCAYERDGEVQVLLVEADELGQDAVVRF